MIGKILKLIKGACICKSSCVVGDEVRVTSENSKDKFYIKISYI